MAAPVLHENQQRRFWSNPTAIYWIAVTAIYGVLATWSIPVPFTLSQSDWDLWQHLSALETLIAHPLSPPNPYIATAEPSRLYGPVHVALGFIGHWLGWTQVQAFGAAVVFALALLAAGQFAFARAYYRTPWGPLALLAATVVGWSVAFRYPGYHSPLSLIADIGYPAGIAIGAGLLAWAWTIRLLECPDAAGHAGLAVLIALMIADHTLGAGIALIGVVSFGALWPAAMAARLRLAAAVLLGLGLAAAWPYYDPYEVLETVNRASWGASVDFYGKGILFRSLVPAIIGVFGLRRPTSAMLALYLAAFLLGLHGSPTSHRFLAPIVLVLHIGLAQLLLTYVPGRKFKAALIAVPLLAVQIWTASILLEDGRDHWRSNGNLLDRVNELLADNPQGIAAFGKSSVVVTSTGRKIYISSYTETLIHDQPQRWAIMDRLYKAPVDRAERLKLARSIGVRVLVLERGVLPAAEVQRLTDQSVRVTTAGPFLRFDLEPQPAGATRSILPSALSVSS